MKHTTELKTKKNGSTSVSCSRMLATVSAVSFFCCIKFVRFDSYQIYSWFDSQWHREECTETTRTGDESS